MAGRILIANELATNRIVLKVKLSAASYDVLQATNKAELLHAALSEQPDLIILDGRFDGGRPIALCSRLNDDAHTTHIPVMILADDFSASERLAALQAGACDVLEKPVRNATLLARIRNILRTNSIEQELRLRRQTAMELGFNETAPDFVAPAQVLVIHRGKETIATKWNKTLRAETGNSYHETSHDDALDTLSSTGLRPDVVILPSAHGGRHDARFLLAELRNRPETRHAGLMVLDNEGNQETIISALDMGANEVISASTSEQEILFRCKRLAKRKRRADMLRNTLEDGLRLAVTDPLTGLYNRRYALPHLQRVAEHAAATGTSFAVMVLDLDRFKRINDTLGHTAGDVVLKEIAARLRANMRSVDLVARIGGEEFLVVMPDTGMSRARVAAERLREIVSEAPVVLGGGRKPVIVTASIGVSVGTLDEAQVSQVHDMVERADQALLGAKSTGRNQVIFEKDAA